MDSRTLSLSCEDIARNQSLANQEEGSHQSLARRDPHLQFPASGTVRRQLLFDHSVYGVFLTTQFMVCFMVAQANVQASILQLIYGPCAFLSRTLHIILKSLKTKWFFKNGHCVKYRLLKNINQKRVIRSRNVGILAYSLSPSLSLPSLFLCLFLSLSLSLSLSIYIKLEI